jgi:hypothetical protein
MLQNAGTNLSVPALTDVVTHRVPHEAMRVFKEVLASLGFVLRIPYLQLGGAPSDWPTVLLQNQLSDTSDATIGFSAT